MISHFPQLFMVTGMGFEPILSALRTQRLNRLTNRPCANYYSRYDPKMQALFEKFKKGRRFRVQGSRKGAPHQIKKRRIYKGKTHRFHTIPLEEGGSEGRGVAYGKAS